MENDLSRVDTYLEQLRNGMYDEAFFGLLEMPHTVLHELIALFQRESDAAIRAFLINVIWQHRQSSVIPFLGEALQDSDSRVWQQAFDGLVALASPESLDILRSANAQHAPVARDAIVFRQYADEAILQIEARLKGEAEA
jgi:hypothetical protein